MGGARHLGRRSGGRRALKLSARQVLELPLPARPWDAGGAMLQAGDVDGCAVQMCAAYGVDPGPLLDWWRAGARPVRLPRHRRTDETRAHGPALRW